MIFHFLSLDPGFSVFPALPFNEGTTPILDAASSLLQPPALSPILLMPWMGVLFTFFTFLIYANWQKMQPYIENALASTPPTSWERLEQLQRQQLLEKNLIEDYCLSLVTIIRYHFSITTKTSEEALKITQENFGLDPIALERLAQMFYLADQIKFNHYQSSAVEGYEMWQAVQYILKSDDALKKRRASAIVPETSTQNS